MGLAVKKYNEWVNGDYQKYSIKYSLEIFHDKCPHTSTIFFDEAIFTYADGSKYEIDLTGENIMTFDVSFKTVTYEGSQEDMVSILPNNGEIKYLEMYLAEPNYINLLN
jgi:hypothetical protein